MSDLYELKKIQGKIYGCFALKDIKEGTLILSKSPEYIYVLLKAGKIILHIEQIQMNFKDLDSVQRFTEIL